MPNETKLTFISDQERAHHEELIQRIITLHLRPRREIAFISGAGIAGLSTAFELLSKGFTVIIGEKRSEFNRFNVINLDVEVQRFLKKFNLLDEFETKVAAKISSHEIVHYTENGFAPKPLAVSDVSKLRPSDVPFEPQFFNQFFTQDGIYSVKIKDLQTFLTNKALDAGVRLFGGVEVNFLDEEQDELAVEVEGKVNIFDIMTKPKQPSLSFVAEGAHSESAEKLGMGIKVVESECTGENWIFGNVKYTGIKTFVVSMIDTSGGSLQIANIIFNSKIQEANIAVTSSRDLAPADINERILMIAQQVFSYKGIEYQPELITAVGKPVHIQNVQRNNYSRGNVFCVGDAAGHSSPLAGMGGTLGLTLVPSAVDRLIKDRDQQPKKMLFAFDAFSKAYTSRWIEKSAAVKRFCISVNEGVSEKRSKRPPCT